MRGLLTASLLVWVGSALPCLSAAAPVEVLALDRAATSPSSDSVISGSLDGQFHPIAKARGLSQDHDYWLKLSITTDASPDGLPVIVMHATRQSLAELFAPHEGHLEQLPRAARLSGFLGLLDSVFPLRADTLAGRPVYVHVTSSGSQPQAVSFSASTLSDTLSQGAERARMIALVFGALVAMATAALLIWFVLKDQLFILYATLFYLQALYIAYLSGQGFDWPGLSMAVPLTSFAWNVPVGLSGAVACLFTREITDIKHFSPRVYAIFGWMAAAFVLVTAANAAKFVGFEPVVNAIGNFMFLAASLFTIVVCCLAWRRGNRAAGWFLIAWGLLEGFTMAAAIGFLVTSALDSDRLYYYELPLSMVASAILVALGVADRLRAQRLALSDAERRAQTDPLTGVLNRRSLIERLDAACLRARARGLPIALLFIDLDHFKQINDSYGHPAGDACLRAIIDPIHAELRQSDVIGRYGGEEFVVILSSADTAAAVPIAKRILERVASVRVDGYGVPISLTCSIGIATSDKLGMWGEQLIAEADAAVYKAKRAGRNQVQVAQPRAA